VCEARFIEKATERGSKVKLASGIVDQAERPRSMPNAVRRRRGSLQLRSVRAGLTCAEMELRASLVKKPNLKVKQTDGSDLRIYLSASPRLTDGRISWQRSFRECREKRPTPVGGENITTSKTASLSLSPCRQARRLPR